MVVVPDAGMDRLHGVRQPWPLGRRASAPSGWDSTRTEMPPGEPRNVPMSMFGTDQFDSDEQADRAKKQARSAAIRLILVTRFLKPVWAAG